ncbi:DUF2007 domain-containing protein [Christiangramia sp.]|uniref:DUF2007 domain-containing protein n=1 Tax=Christiangramia sp. TaxID=1931228 RepID=UPI00261C3795|nr:DUF2007 domain-containing protein [Christiangramia sp.]
MKAYKYLATFTYHHEYFVLKLQLEVDGIEHYFQNETLIGLLPLSSFAIGGIRLMVHPSHVSKAKQILDSLNDKSSNLRIV